MAILTNRNKDLIVPRFQLVQGRPLPFSSKCRGQPGREANGEEVSPHFRDSLLLALAIYPGQSILTTCRIPPGNIGQRSVLRYAVLVFPILTLPEPLQHRFGISRDL